MAAKERWGETITPCDRETILNILLRMDFPKIDAGPDFGTSVAPQYSLTRNRLHSGEENPRHFNQIEGASMHQSVEKKYRKGYVLRFSLMSLLAAVFCFILSYGSAAYAIDITLAWDSPATGTPDGYRVFYHLDGESYDYNNPAWEGPEATCTIQNLQDVTTYFVVRAYNAAGESADSNEAIYQAEVISLSPSSLSASCSEGANAPSQSFEVRNSGRGTMSYAVGTTANWVSCTPASGTSTGESDPITVTYNTSGLAPGTYSATITIAAAGASNSPQTIPVTVNVGGSPAQASSGGSGGGGVGCFIATAAGQGPQEAHHLPVMAFVLIAVALLLGTFLYSRRR
jgi:hypothetical protein